MSGPIIIAIILLAISALLFKRGRKQEKIFNVYTQPGDWYCIKYFTFLVIIWIRTQKAKLLRTFAIDKLEKIKPLSSDEKAFDATFFHAVSKSGIYLCGGIERRHHGKANALLYLVVPELGLLESVKLPKTLLDADPASILLSHEYSAGGITFAPVEPMKKWRLSYSGKMRLYNDPTKLLDVKLESEWTSDLPYFLFDTDMNLKSLAKAIATETWTKQYFEALKAAHQSHYEQMGYLNGQLTVADKIYELQMDSFRDHSFGNKRDWSLMHRYVFHMLYLEDGTRVSIGIVSQPCTTSQLEMGYVVLPDKTIHTIGNFDFRLYQHGENGNPGIDYAFSFDANKETYETQVRVIHQSFHFKGNDIEAKLLERFIECTVNGVKGRGISEWHYNNLEK